jgi:antitoxin component HigA of HigAB toxin-antitoxin module
MLPFTVNASGGDCVRCRDSFGDEHTTWHTLKISYDADTALCRLYLSMGVRRQGCAPMPESGNQREILILAIDSALKEWYSVAMRKTKTTSGLEAPLRQAMAESGRSQRQLAALAGVDPAQVSYFMQGKRSLTLRSAEKIAAVLGLELVQTKKAR